MILNNYISPVLRSLCRFLLVYRQYMNINVYKYVFNVVSHLNINPQFHFCGTRISGPTALFFSLCRGLACFAHHCFGALNHRRKLSPLSFPANIENLDRQTHTQTDTQMDTWTKHFIYIYIRSTIQKT